MQNRKYQPKLIPCYEIDPSNLLGSQEIRLKRYRGIMDTIIEQMLREFTRAEANPKRLRTL